MNRYDVGADPYALLSYRRRDCKRWIFFLPNTIKDAPHSAHAVDFKGGRGEALSMVGIGITSGVVAILNVNPERSKAASDKVIPPDVRLGANRFADIDGVTVCEFTVEH